jgi:hypothetical protein
MLMLCTQLYQVGTDDKLTTYRITPNWLDAAEAFC